MKKIILFVGLSLFFYSCQEKNHGQNEQETNLTELKADGASIVEISQKALMGKVFGAIKEGGSEYAVEFCNHEAMPIADSLSKSNNVHISRITERTRNPKNNLKTDLDKVMYRTFAENGELKDSLAKDGDHFVYYSRINLAMPDCLQCHGIPEKEINLPTYEKLQTLYPDDKATRYGLNDFRGLWRIEM